MPEDGLERIIDRLGLDEIAAQLHPLAFVDPHGDCRYRSLARSGWRARLPRLSGWFVDGP